jgi:hypothetical protein
MDCKSFNKAALGPGRRSVAVDRKWVRVVVVIQVEGFGGNLAIARSHSPLVVLIFSPAR